MFELFTGAQPLVGGESGPDLLEKRIGDLDTVDVIDRVLIGYSSIWPHNHAWCLTRSRRPVTSRRSWRTDRG